MFLETLSAQIFTHVNECDTSFCSFLLAHELLVLKVLSMSVYLQLLLAPKSLFLSL